MSEKSSPNLRSFRCFRHLGIQLLLLLLIITLIDVTTSFAQHGGSHEFPNLAPSREVKRGAKYGFIAFIALAVIYALARLASTSERRLSPSQARPHDASLAFDPLTQPAPIFPDEMGQEEEDEEKHARANDTKTASPLIDFIPERYENVEELSSLVEGAQYIRFKSEEVELRLLKSELSRDLAAKAKFIKVGKKLQELDHENLFSVKSVENETWPFWELEAIAGKSLEDGKPDDGGYSCCQVLEVGAPLLRLLDYLCQEKQRIGELLQSTVFVDEEGRPIVAHMDPLCEEQPSGAEYDGAAAVADLLSLARLLEVLTEEHGRPQKFDDLINSMRDKEANISLDLLALATKAEELATELPCAKGWELRTVKIEKSENSKDGKSADSTEPTESSESSESSKGG